MKQRRKTAPKESETGVPIYSRKVQDWIVVAADDRDRTVLADQFPHIPVFTLHEMALLRGETVRAIQIAMMAKKTFGSNCDVLGVQRQGNGNI